MIPQYLFRVVSPEEWQKSLQQGYVETSIIDRDFIHLSTKEQLPHILEKFWPEKKFIILKLDSSKLEGRLVYEANPGGTTKYYHLYEGKIPLEVIVE